MEQRGGRLQSERAERGDGIRCMVLPHYVLVRNTEDGRELFRASLRSGERALPAFCSRSSAQNFIAAGIPRQGWYAESRSRGEMSTLLLALCAEIEWVLLDPLPGVLAARNRPANLMRWENFVDYLLDGQELRSGSAANGSAEEPRRRLVPVVEAPTRGAELGGPVGSRDPGRREIG